MNMPQDTLKSYILETSSKLRISTDLKSFFQIEVVGWHTAYTHWCSETVQVDSATAKKKLTSKMIYHRGESLSEHALLI